MANYSSFYSALRADHLFRYAIEYHISVFVLYCLQVKWTHLNLVGEEVQAMRDFYMHGEGIFLFFISVIFVCLLI
jgi:hypothetical protein